MISMVGSLRSVLLKRPTWDNSPSTNSNCTAARVVGTKFASLRLPSLSRDGIFGDRASDGAPSDVSTFVGSRKNSGGLNKVNTSGLLEKKLSLVWVSKLLPRS